MRISVGRRRIATAERGRLCLVDEDVCQGDMIYVFFGGRMPIILRLLEDYYHFIADLLCSLVDVWQGGREVRGQRLPIQDICHALKKMSSNVTHSNLPPKADLLSQGGS